MDCHIKFTSFYEYNDELLTLLYTKFPSLQEESIVNIHAICWLYDKEDEVLGVVLCKHDNSALVLYKLSCFDEYDEKLFIFLIRQQLGNDKRIILQTTANHYDRLSRMRLNNPVVVVLQPSDALENVQLESESQCEIVSQSSSSQIGSNPEKRKAEEIEDRPGLTYKVFLQSGEEDSMFNTHLGEAIDKDEVIRLYEQFASLIGNRHAISMFDMNNHSNYKDFMNKKDGDKVVLITLCNGVPETFMIIGDLTEEKDKLKSVQITQLYSNLNFYKALTYCHFYKWYEQKNGTGSLIRLESPKNDLQFYKEMNMVVDEEWNVLYSGWNHRMAIVGVNVPPSDRYKVTLKKTIDKKNKSSHLR
jgi:hypothetical protein